MSYRIAVAFVVMSLWGQSALRADLIQDFDTTGTPYVLNAGGAGAVVGGGPTGNFLRLVNGGGSQNNNIGFDQTDPGLLNGVDLNFDFRLTPVAGRADGFGVAFLSTADYGTTGAAPTISEEPNLTNSLGIGFDIYPNGAPTDPANPPTDNNHLSLHFNNVLLGTFDPTFNLANGLFNHAEIQVDFVNSTVTVILTSDINGTPGTPTTVLDHVLVAGLSAYDQRLGLGARTGGETSNADFDNFGAVPVPEPSTWALLGMTGAFAGAAWRRRRAAARAAA